MYLDPDNGNDHIRQRVKAQALAFQQQFAKDSVPFPEARLRKHVAALQQAVPKGTQTPPSLTFRVLSKMAFGPSQADLAWIDSLPGATEQDRVLNYIDLQLNPAAIDDSALEAQLAADFQTLDKSRTQMWAEHENIPDNTPNYWDVKTQPAWELTHATFARAVRSKRQLEHVLSDFWFNHFNVYADDTPIESMLVHYERDVLRQHVLGNFRDMVLAVTKSVCMGFYLDNAFNNQYGPNENFARELLELHTLGAGNYYQHLPWDQVPVDSQGRRVGYVEADVLEMARALTGWSYDGAIWEDYQNGNTPTGAFLFRDGNSWPMDFHDRGTKRVLGQFFSYDPGNPQKDLLDIIDMLCEHPGTAGFVAKKLCRRFVSDNPPQSLVDQVANTFQQNWQAPNQLQLTMETLLKSPEFLNTWGEKVKRPFEKVVATMRATDYSHSFYPGFPGITDTHPRYQELEYTNWLFWTYLNSGQRLHHWAAPNGFPDKKAAWLGASSLMATWNTLQVVCHTPYDDSLPEIAPIVGQTQAHFTTTGQVTSAENLVDYWHSRLCGIPASGAARQALVDFMSYDDVENPVPNDPTVPIDLSIDDWPSYNRSRLRTMVSMIAMSRPFNNR